MKFRVHNAKGEMGTYEAATGMAAIAKALRKEGFDAVAVGDSLQSDAPEKVLERISAEPLE